jgi:xanthine dehydrogenase accessory factor
LTITRSAFLDFTSNPAEIAFCEILRSEGSSPREVGAWMLIKGSGKILGTIGGGQLEYKVVEKVKEQDWKLTFELNMETKLGPEIGQCCGGKILVSITKFSSELKANLLSRIDEEASNYPEILIFGAGNIGISLANQLHHLPLRVTLIDNRKKHILSLNRYYKTKFSLIPEQEIRDASPNSAFIIVTHDHGLDFMLCYEALLRNDIAYLGMIGSKSKKAVLVHWLNKKGITDVSRVKIPIGNTFFESKDKRPEIISGHIISEMLFNLEMHESHYRIQNREFSQK